ncbi:hypothetical protein SAZ10_24125 [Mesorhizobium sp. BAC0120]|uniref:hypothetical protein n=1 Tax=Mesorhizobium sp. BAC0120 TaxID=3090670 RepID=UPI00298CF266|nr:hypothetical protein [Mesorhizobium sp. BAC0120]MDW6024846.1 hypothetical protein [Mesorhizobium sp. BAC0120]
MGLGIVFSLGLATMLTVAGCQAVDLTALNPEFMPRNAGRKCTPAPNNTELAAIQLSAFGGPDLATSLNFADFSESFQLQAVEARIARARAALPGSLRNDPVVDALLNNSLVAIERSLTRTVRQRQLSPMLLSGHHASHQTVTLDTQSFRLFAEKIQQFMATPVSISDQSQMVAAVGLGEADEMPRFETAFREYYEAYFDGGFRDRLGGKFPKPGFSTRIGNEQLASTVAVFVELVLDYALYTPVWRDKMSGNYYPGASNEPPTVLAAGVIKAPEPLVAPGYCGISKLKAAVVGYVSQLVGHGATLSGSLFAGTFGGWSVGLGIVGNISVGDNQTLQAMVQAVLEQSFARVGEQTAYQMLYFINDSDANLAPSGSLPRLGIARLVESYLVSARVN